MKLPILFFSALLAAAVLFAPRIAEAGCAKDEIDPVSGEPRKVAGTGKEPWTDSKVGGQSSFSFQRSGSRLTLQIDLIQSGALDGPLGNEEPVKFRLDSGTVIELKPLQASMAEADTWGTNVYTRWPVAFEVTEEQLTQFATTRTIAIIIPFAGQAKVWEPQKGIATLLQSSAKCLTKQ